MHRRSNVAYDSIRMQEGAIEKGKIAQMLFTLGELNNNHDSQWLYAIIGPFLLLTKWSELCGDAISPRMHEYYLRIRREIAVIQLY